ncbi:MULTISPECIES: LacI family DNA-binding transcriptional regulator [Nitrospirillum]|uniref:LacI family transcriptional regulator n=1 Tax=Nitrospirillum amazonense TaxID=28077 RepID=A0A560GDA0_9PROT|nr:LacI family DNA-binding transcriptional regulator [Nitrospirillum amazonense]MEC4594270.1 LacI family DNA-binding transcriptional regulator [Nitrospirillum amazonense]TWB31791.1 LacI family transcriptional regulator [Nitrospirillum amazonense]
MSKATIYDVARVANVSIKTVSRVLNGEPKASAETRARVMEAARSLNYTPSLSARALSGSRSFLIALVSSGGVSDNAMLYVTELQMGAIQACRAGGYHLLTEYIDLGASDFTALTETLVSTLRVDGVILIPPLCDDPQLLSLLARRGVTCVRISPTLDSSAEEKWGWGVDIDNYQAAFQMTRHLMDQGHRDIGFIQGHPKHAAAAQREAGYRDALFDGGPIPDRLIQPGLFTFDSGLSAARALLEQPRRPTAIFAANDSMAMAVLSVAYKMGIPVPGALSVAGIDDLPAASVVCPPLTTVRQPVMEMGAAAARFIIDRTAGQVGSYLKKVFDHSLVVRESTAPPA